MPKTSLRRQASPDEPKTIIRLLELAYGAQLEAALKRTQYLGWADFFNEVKAQQKRQIVFGFQRGNMTPLAWNPITQTKAVEMEALFELQVRVYDLRNHERALDLVHRAVTDVLNGYKPFLEVEPLLPVTYGDPTYDEELGQWVYAGGLTTTLNPNLETLTPVKNDPMAKVERIKIGLYNETAPKPVSLVLDSEQIFEIGGDRP